MTVGTLVRKRSNQSIGVIVKVMTLGQDVWCKVLYSNETIIGEWDLSLIHI